MTITDLLNDVASAIHGTTINKIPNVYGILNRAARAVLLDIDPKETQRVVQLSQVFNSIYDYALPADVKGDRIIDLRPQAGRKPSDIFTQGYAQSFDAQKLVNLSNKIYTQWNTGIKTIRIEAPTLTAPTTICDTGSTTGWTQTTGGTITLDQTNNVAGSGALVFNFPAGGPVTGILNTTLTPVDISGLENTGTLFFWVYLPDASVVTNLEFDWGDNVSTDYWYYNATTTQQGTAFQDGWNLIAVPWASATMNGTPDSSSVNAIALLIDYSGAAQTGVKFCNVTVAPGYIFEIQYYSKYLFRDPATNAFQEKIVDSSDDSMIINLDTESYNLLFNKFAFLVAQSIQGADAQYDADFWQKEYEDALKRYKGQNPSEAMKKGETYYKMPRKGYNKYSPGAWFR